MGFLFNRKKKMQTHKVVAQIAPLDVKAPVPSIQGNSDSKTDDLKFSKDLKVINEQWAQEKEKRDRLHEQRMAALDFLLLIPANESIEFNDTELNFLDYVDGLKVAKPKIAKRWTELNVDFQKTLKKFFKAGVLQFNEKQTALQLTDKGVKLISAHKKDDREALWQKTGESIRENAKAGHIGLYRNDLFTLSEIDKDEGRQMDELIHLLYICCLDLFGFSDLGMYRIAVESKMEFVSPSPCLAPSVINRIARVAKVLSLTPADVEAICIRETCPEKIPPDPVVGIQTCAKLVRMHLEGKGKEADKLLKQETVRYIKTHQK